VSVGIEVGGWRCKVEGVSWEVGCGVGRWEVRSRIKVVG
jgi:hypothetical protein